MRKRLIPVMLLDRRRRLVKTVRFGERTYIGDPFNVMRLFNEKEVDEICVLDIDATTDDRTPDFGFLRELASECFMPLSYGGGIASMAHCEQLNRLGVEKFVFGTSGYDLDLIAQASAALGSQAIVGCVDVVTGRDGTQCVSNSGCQPRAVTPLEHCLALQRAGAGEIILQSVDNDGSRQGMDLDLIRDISHRLDIPLVALGGAGELAHLGQALAAGASAAASGSTFSFIGRLRAVLVTYPGRIEIDQLSREYA